MSQTPDDQSQHLADEVDDALEAMWQGQSGKIEELISDDDHAHSTQGVGQLFRAAQEKWEASAAPMPTHIGNYDIICELGRGGMGVVYEAIQRQPHRRVALKVIRGGYGLDSMHLKLFQREVQTLARLKHSGIASIYDAGQTADGQHFFAMELVPGESLSDYVNGRNERGEALTLVERLQLFCRLCDAINYAHQRGVIHRDLKPSNILVVTDEDGSSTSSNTSSGPQIKVLDFGLARITDQDVAVTTVVTEPGRVIGTLRYMSPEQARGISDEIDVRSDVYSLSVILYELVTGQPPYELNRGMPHEAFRVICEDAPHKPSMINRALRGDLETILLKGLEKDAKRRYQSAASLLEDIQRYMAGQPISARPPSTMYQLRKLVGRHKLACAFVCTVFMLLVTLVVATGWQNTMIAKQRDLAELEKSRADEQAVLAERQRDMAQAEKGRADEQAYLASVAAQRTRMVNAFLLDMLGSVHTHQSNPRDISVREILDRTAQNIGRDLAGQPEIEGAIRDTIGQSYLSLGLYDEATAQLERALEAHQTAFGEEHEATIDGMSHLASAYARTARLAEAEELYDRALLLSNAMWGEQDGRTLTTMNNLSGVYRDQGRTDEAIALLEQSLSTARAVHGDEDSVTLHAMYSLASMIYDTGAAAEAEPLVREVLSAYELSYGSEHPLTLEVISLLGAVLENMGDLEEALAHYELALAGRQVILGDAHPDTLATMNNMAGLLRQRGDFDRAIELFETVIDHSENTLGRDHPRTITSINNLAGLYRLQGKLPEAEALYNQVIEGLGRVLGADHPHVYSAKSNLAMVLKEQARFDDAESLYLEILDPLVELLGPSHINTLSVMNNLAALYKDRGRLEEAVEMFARVVAIGKQTLTPQSVHLAVFRTQYGAALLAIGNTDQAAEELQDSCAILNSKLAADHPHVAGCSAALQSLQDLRAEESPANRE